MDKKQKPVAAADQDPDAVMEDSITMDDGLAEWTEEDDVAPGEDDEEDEEDDDDDGA